MWIIIATIFVVDTYGTLYSFVLFLWSDDECFIQSNVSVRSFTTVFSRSVQFLWWLYPIMWLFWPKELTCRKHEVPVVKQPRVKHSFTTGSSQEEDESSYGDHS